ncbi:MAG: hypothetical protein IJV24_03155 [Prevotella sp.]|nr:hypothetical protein [Prevotella sp.]
MKQEETLFGGPWEGLCLVKNYDGACCFDTARDTMEPTEKRPECNVDFWPAKCAAFRMHEDMTMDVLVHHSTEYSTLLRWDACEIWRTMSNVGGHDWSTRRGVLPMEKWIEFPSCRPIPFYSENTRCREMVRTMLQFDGIDKSQFIEREAERKNVIG